MKDYLQDNDYLAIVDNLIQTPMVQELDHYTQHHYKSRLDHVISVSYQSYRLAKWLDLDAQAVARAGILHDLFYYDWRETKFELGNHAFIHPRVALRNAEKLTHVTGLEQDIILHHMYPSGYGGGMPQSAEAWLVDLVDDWLAVKEGVTGFSQSLLLKLKRV